MNPYSRGSMPHSSNFGNDLDMNDAPTRNLPFNNPRRPSTDAFSGRCQMALIKRIPTRKRRREEELQSDDSGGSLLSRSGSKRLRSDLGMALEVPPPANLLNLHSSLQEYEEELPPFIDEALEAVEAKAERQHAIQFRALPSKPGDDQLIRNLPPPTIVYPELDVNAPWLYMEHVRHEVCHVLKTVLAVVTDKNYKNASVQTILSAFLGCAFKGDLTHQQFVSCVKRLERMASSPSWYVEKVVRPSHHYRAHPEGSYRVIFVNHPPGESCDDDDTPGWHTLAWTYYRKKLMCFERLAFEYDQHKLLHQQSRELKEENNLKLVTKSVTATFIHEMAHLDADECIDVHLDPDECIDVKLIGGRVACYNTGMCQALARKRPPEFKDTRQTPFSATKSLQGPFQNADSIARAITLIYLSVARPDLRFIPPIRDIRHDRVVPRKKRIATLWRWKGDLIDTYTPPFMLPKKKEVVTTQPAISVQETAPQPTNGVQEVLEEMRSKWTDERLAKLLNFVKDM